MLREAWSKLLAPRGGIPSMFRQVCSSVARDVRAELQRILDTVRSLPNRSRRDKFAFGQTVLSLLEDLTFNTLSLISVLLSIVYMWQSVVLRNLHQFSYLLGSYVYYVAFLTGLYLIFIQPFFREWISWKLGSSLGPRIDMRRRKMVAACVFAGCVFTYIMADVWYSAGFV
eukprot:2630574-Prymnesium_polylepis.1